MQGFTCIRPIGGGGGFIVLPSDLSTLRQRMLTFGDKFTARTFASHFNPGQAAQAMTSPELGLE